MEYILLFIAALLLSFYLGMEWEKLKHKETIDFIEQYLLNKFGFSKDGGIDVIGQLKIMELIEILKNKNDEKVGNGNQSIRPKDRGNEILERTRSARNKRKGC